MPNGTGGAVPAPFPPGKILDEKSEKEQSHA
jgi:hypothetical protein